MPESALSGGDVVLVTIVLAVSLAALAFAAYLVRAVMAADQGTPTMREIAQAVQEGAAAYLRRQFRTLAVFAVIVFLLLLVLPVHDGGWGTRIGRALFFLLGALANRLRFGFEPRQLGFGRGELRNRRLFFPLRRESIPSEFVRVSL